MVIHSKNVGSWLKTFDTIALQKNNVNTPFYDCKIKDFYCKLYSAHSLSSVFESGAVKIQRGVPDSLMAEEQEDCTNLKVHAQPINESHQGEDGGSVNVLYVRKTQEQSTGINSFVHEFEFHSGIIYRNGAHIFSCRWYNLYKLSQN